MRKREEVGARRRKREEDGDSILIAVSLVI